MLHGVRRFRSTDGSVTWGRPTIASLTSHDDAGSLRSGPLPSAEVDGAGRVYVVWADCRFRSHCAANDIVLSTSTDGKSWSKPARIPIGSTKSPVDHFIPGIAVDASTSRSNKAKLAVAYVLAGAPTAGGSDCTTATPHCDQATYAPAVGLAATSGRLSSGDESPAPGARSDHPAPSSPVSRR